MYCRSHPSSLVVIAIGVLCCHSSLFLPPARAESQPETFAPEKLQEIYRGLPEEDKQVVDSWPPAEKERYLREKAETRRERLFQQPEQATRDYSGIDETPVLYTADPLVKQAMTKYKDSTVPREEVIEAFNAYLEKTPDSIFLPEVYFRIGALYSMHRRVELGEEYDRQKMIEYFDKAHEIYGTKYCHLHRTAWASLANMPEKGLEFRKQYLKWIQGISEMDVNDVWPVLRIEHAINGHPPQLSVAQKEGTLRNFQKYQDMYFENASKSIFYIEASNYQALVDLMESFPGTELAEQCSRLAERMNQFYLDAVDMNGPQASVPALEAEQGGLSTAGMVPSEIQGTAQHTDADADPNGELKSNVLSQEGTGGRRGGALAWCGAIIAVIAVWMFVRRARMRTKAVTGDVGRSES